MAALDPGIGRGRQEAKTLKHDLALRPIFHQLEHRIEVHIFIAFLAYYLHVTLGWRLVRRCTSGTDARLRVAGGVSSISPGVPIIVVAPLLDRNWVSPAIS